jgi:hypothetical protein
MHSVKYSAQVSRSVLLSITLLSAIIIRAACAQSHDIDGTFLVDAKINGSPRFYCSTRVQNIRSLIGNLHIDLASTQLRMRIFKGLTRRKIPRSYSCLTLTFNPFTAAV